MLQSLLFFKVIFKILFFLLYWETVEVWTLRSRHASPGQLQKDILISKEVIQIVTMLVVKTDEAPYITTVFNVFGPFVRLRI